MNKNFKKIFKHHRTLFLFVLVFIVSAFSGAVFGFYGASLFGNGILPSVGDLVPLKIGGEKARVVTEESLVIDVVKKSSPAVVSIVATKDLTIVERRGIYNPFEEFCKDPFFRQFLGGQCDIKSQPPQTRTEKQQISAGSGFLISSDGLILTNKHVVNDTEAEFTAIMNDGKKYNAKILARDPIQDLAIIKIEATGLRYLALGDSDKIEIGQTVIAIGNALGRFSNSVSKGVISGLSRSIVANEGNGSSERLDQVIQTDAAINPGNSGGPLLNLSGEVVGINTAIVQDAQNIGFAIPINQAKRDVDQVKTSGKISYPFLGVRYVVIDDNLKEKNNLPVNYGALIVGDQSQNEPAVVSGSPAEKAGLREGDIILEVNGKKIAGDIDLSKALQDQNPGDTAVLKILSQGQEKNVSVVLGERK